MLPRGGRGLQCTETRDFRQNLCMRCSDWFAYPSGPAAFRERHRESFREPDAVTPHVRFDEREQETEPCQTGLRRPRESHAN
jgi:hypothetical protein